MSRETSAREQVTRFFSKPVVGIVGSIASVIGLGLAVFFYSAEQKGRELTVFVHPVRTAVVKAGQASRLSVRFDENEIKGDVSAVQVALWNRGALPIRPTNILKPIQILTPGCKILEASIRKQSRDVVNTSLDTSRLTEGKLGVSWDILEQNDGSILQIIYAGSDSTQIEFSGVIEGEGSLHVRYSEIVRGGEDRLQSDLAQQRFIAWMSIGEAAFLFITFLLLKWRFVRPDSNVVFPWKMLGPPLIVAALLMLATGLFLLFSTRHWGPPFGF